MMAEKTVNEREYSDDLIKALNDDIKGFPQVHGIADDMEASLEGVSRLVMLDRYSYKDTEKVTLKEGDLVVLTIKPDPQFPTRGIGYVNEINGDNVLVELLPEYRAATGGYTEMIDVHIDLVDKPLEIYFEQIAARVARGLSEVEAEEKRGEVFEEFYRELSSFNFIPAGRVLYGAGSDTGVTFFNCLAGETVVQTKDGSCQIKDLEGEVEVLSMGGVYRKAHFKSYGVQELYEVELSNGEKIRATAGHEWYYNSPKGGLLKTNTLNLEGKNIPTVNKTKKLDSKEVHEGIKHGIVFGDGTLQHGKANVKLFGNKIELVRFFHGEHITPHYEGDYVGIYNLPNHFKELPKDSESESYWQGFVVGLIATDGYVDDRGSFGFHSKDLEELEYIAYNLHKTNFFHTSIRKTRETSPFDGTYAPLYKIQLAKRSGDSRSFIRTKHLNNFENSAKSDKTPSVKVVKVTPLRVEEEVFCCEEPETNSFVIGTGILTSNCFVMPYPKDSREGLSEHRGEVMEIMSRGGGVGTNGSTLRPRNALARGVNGKSSGAVSWLHDLSELTHLVEQGGSRRGAQMIMMADWHPDIIEFVISKMQNPDILRHIINTTKDDQIKQLAQEKLKFEPMADEERAILETYTQNTLTYTEEEINAMKHAEKLLKDGGRYSIHNPDSLTGANISVAITKEFMEAVENGEDYELRFPDIENYSEYDMALYNDTWHEYGDVREWESLGFGIKMYRTIRARDLWELINVCATYSAEPGVFFIDNANDMTNAKAYGQKVVSTNPCGEQPLAPYSVCNLAAVNLANMVDKERKEVDFEKLERTVRTGVRLQDNVIDSTPYFLKANEEQALGERRLGLGVMGLHDLLIYCEKTYGSEEGNALVDKVFETIAITAYRTSIELAKEKGSFPLIDGDGKGDKRAKLISGGFISTLPKSIRQDIYQYGLRNSHILTVAPTGSTGTMVGVSTGLEPYFAFKYFRSGRLGKFIEVNAAIVDELGVDADNLPGYFVSAMELPPEAHADVQTIIQRWVDSSISKTVNAPKGYTVEQVQTIYERLYKGGAKGGTVYVDGSRDSQVLSLESDDNEKDESVEESQEIGIEIGDKCPICRDGTVIEQGGCNSCNTCGTQLKCEV